MALESDKYLFDILASIRIIEGHLINIKTLDQYENDIKTIDAVERRLSIIGEALNKAVSIDPLLRITDQRKIIGLRHILIHNYDVTDSSTIWTTIQEHLPLLKNEVEQLLNE